MPRLAARAFERLLAHDDGRMTAAELTAALDVSPAAVSAAVRYLTQVALITEQLGLINERWEVRKAQLLADWSRNEKPVAGSRRGYPRSHG